jgi:hypothetical protein
MCWLFVFFLTTSTYSYPMQQQSTCSAASLVNNAGQRMRLVRDQNSVDCVPVGCIDIEKKLCAIIARFDPSVNIASLQNIHSLLQYRSFDGKTILHIAVACAKTLDDIAVLKEIIQRNKELLFAIDKTLQACIWCCYEPVVLNFLLQEMEEISIQRCQMVTNSLNIRGYNFLQHLVALRAVPVVDRNKIFMCIRCFIEHGYAIGVPQRELLATCAATATADQEVLFLCDRIIFIRQCVSLYCTVEQVSAALSLHFSKQPSFVDCMRDMLLNCPKEKLFVHAIIEKAYPLSGASCEKYVSFLKMLVNYSDGAIVSLVFIVEGTTLLHAAAFHNDIGMVSLLLKKGFNVNSVDRLQNTPLHIALLKNKIASAKALIRAANTQSKNIFGVSSYAIMAKKYPELLVDCQALPPAPLSTAATAAVSAFGQEQRLMVSELDVYKKIAYMSYNNAIEYLCERVVDNQEICAHVIAEITPYQDGATETMPLMSLIVKKSCQDVGNGNHVKLLRKLFSLQVLLNKLFLESLSEQDNPFFIAIEYANKDLIECMVAYEQDIVHCRAGLPRILAIDYAINRYVESNCIERLDIVRVMLELGTNFSTMMSSRIINDEFAHVVEPYQFESFMTAVRLYLECPCLVDYIRIPIERLCAFSETNHSAVELNWSSQRLIVICALYYMETLHAIDCDFYQSQLPEEMFLCAMLIANKMHNDCFDKKFIQNNFPELSKEDIKRLYALKFEMGRRLLSCNTQHVAVKSQCSETHQDACMLYLSAQQLNRFFIDRIYNCSSKKVIL